MEAQWQVMVEGAGNAGGGERGWQTGVAVWAGRSRLYVAVPVVPRGGGPGWLGRALKLPKHVPFYRCTFNESCMCIKILTGLGCTPMRLLQYL